MSRISAGFLCYLPLLLVLCLYGFGAAAVELRRRRVFRAFDIPQTSDDCMAACRAKCREWKKGAYVAVVLTAADNRDLHQCVTRSKQSALLGGQRQVNGTDATRFRWTEGPLGSLDGGRGMPFWTTEPTYANGVCENETYCNFYPGEPNNYGGGEPVLHMTWEGRWNDDSCSRTRTCACRWDWDATEFAVVGHQSDRTCREECAVWAPGGYPATIVDAEEETQVARLTCSAHAAVALGGDTSASGTLRWTDGPLGSQNGTIVWEPTNGGVACWGYCSTPLLCEGWHNGSSSLILRCNESEQTLGWTTTSCWSSNVPCACRRDLLLSSSSTVTWGVSKSLSQLHTATASSTLSPTATSSRESPSLTLSPARGSVSVTQAATMSSLITRTVSRNITSSPSTTATLTVARSSVTASISTVSNSVLYNSTTPTKSSSASESYRCHIDHCAIVGLSTGPDGTSESQAWQDAGTVQGPGSLTWRSVVPYNVAASNSVALGVALRCGAYPLPLLPSNATLIDGGGHLGMTELPGRDDHTLRLILDLGNTALLSGWLPLHAFPYRPGTAIRIGLSIACDGRRSVVLTVPVEPLPQPAIVVASGQVSAGLQWTSSLAGASSGSVVGRVGAVRGVALCSSLGASTGGLLGLSLPRDGDAEDNGIIPFARGAVVGNLCLCFLFCAAAAMLLLCWAYALFTQRSYREALLRAALPSSLLPAWAATVQSTSAALPLLLASSSVTPADAAIVAVGVVALLVPMSFLLCVSVIVARSGGELQEVVGSAAGDESSKVPIFFRHWLHRGRRWRSRTNDPALRLVWYVLCDYNVVLFCPLDAGVLILSAVAASASGLGSVAVCRAAGVVTLLLFVGELALVVVLRPFRVPLMNLLTAVTLALTSVGLMIQLVAVFTTSGGAGVARAFLDASSACMLAVLGIAALRMMGEAAQSCRACVRLKNDAVQERKEALEVAARRLTPPDNSELSAVLVAPTVPVAEAPTEALDDNVFDVLLERYRDVDDVIDSDSQALCTLREMTSKHEHDLLFLLDPFSLSLDTVAHEPGWATQR